MSYKVSVAIEFLDGSTVEHGNVQDAEIEGDFLFVRVGDVGHGYNVATVARYVVAREEVQELSNLD